MAETDAAIGQPANDDECYTLPNGECVAPNCKLHGPLEESIPEPLRFACGCYLDAQVINGDPTLILVPHADDCRIVKMMKTEAEKLGVDWTGGEVPGNDSSDPSSTDRTSPTEEAG